MLDGRSIDGDDEDVDGLPNAERMSAFDLRVC